ncbi:hypothetical protein DXA13_10380 [Clostridium sp. AM58-1XD]|nr:hypothetical protein DXA13_10380 [Clostridium sp. AM58-1XD]
MAEPPWYIFGCTDELIYLDQFYTLYKENTISCGNFLIFTGMKDTLKEQRITADTVRSCLGLAE